MTDFRKPGPSLMKAVQQALEEETIGPPVFIRWVVATAQEEAELLPRLGSMLEAAELWMGEGAQRIYALGEPQAGQVTAMVDYAGGQSALLTAALAGPRGERIDLTLLGQRGAIFHEDILPDVVSDSPESSPMATRFAAAVEEALRCRQPVDFKVK